MQIVQRTINYHTQSAEIFAIDTSLYDKEITLTLENRVMCLHLIVSNLVYIEHRGQFLMGRVSG
jgi:hypothetical protein